MQVSLDLEGVLNSAPLFSVSKVSLAPSVLATVPNNFGVKLEHLRGPIYAYGGYNEQVCSSFVLQGLAEGWRFGAGPGFSQSRPQIFATALSPNLAQLQIMFIITTESIQIPPYRRINRGVQLNGSYLHRLEAPQPSGQ